MMALGIVIRVFVWLALYAVLFCFAETGVAKFFSEFNSVGFISGIMVFASFLLSIRTFLIFKLNETVYSTKDYQEYKKGIDGSFNTNKMYYPLEFLDFKLGWNLIECVATIFICIAAIAFKERCDSLPRNPIAPIPLASILYLLCSFTYTLFSINKNFQAIISWWAYRVKGNS